MERREVYTTPGTRLLGIHDVADSDGRTVGRDGLPTPRWTAYDAKHYGIDLPKETTMQLQERAFTSPIWYTP